MNTTTRPRLWVEAGAIGSVYVVYSIVRNRFGSASVSSEVALRNADRIIDLEKTIGLWVEPDVQRWFIDWTAFMQFWNLFYGLFHFLVTFLVLVWLWKRHPVAYRLWRTAGLVATSTAIVGYAAFPLMPPRLLADCGEFGGCRLPAEFVDSVVELGGLWSFESEGLAAVSNQYAAMPSLHIGWALWCALAVWFTSGSRPLRVVAAAYPALTLFAIVVTANHYWFDAVGGVAVVGVGCAASLAVARLRGVASPAGVVAEVDRWPASAPGTRSDTFVTGAD